MENRIKFKIEIATNAPIKVRKYTKNKRYLTTYRSAYYAAQQNKGSQRESILRCCEGRVDDHNGFIWVFDRKESRPTSKY